MRWLTISIIAGLTLASSCAVVKPYERENLSRPAMAGQTPAGLTRFEQHRGGSREGADGGTGEPGGGCGCN